MCAKGWLLRSLLLRRGGQQLSTRCTQCLEKTGLLRLLLLRLLHGRLRHAAGRRSPCGHGRPWPAAAFREKHHLI